MLLLFDAAAGALGGILLRKADGSVDLFETRPVSGFIKDRLVFDILELGLEVVHGMGRAVGATTGCGEGEALIVCLFAWLSPVASSSTFLLDLFGVGIDVTVLGEVAGKVLFSGSGAIGKANVVTVILLVGASHIERRKDLTSYFREGV